LADAHLACAKPRRDHNSLNLDPSRRNDSGTKDKDRIVTLHRWYSGFLRKCSQIQSSFLGMFDFVRRKRDNFVRSTRINGVSTLRQGFPSRDHGLTGIPCAPTFSSSRSTRLVIKRNNLRNCTRGWNYHGQGPDRRQLNLPRY
jgi:hypothetical protein